MAERSITIEPYGGRVRVVAVGEVIADTDRALLLAEAGYPAVVYVPRQDARMDRLTRSLKVTQCPHKGERSYFHLNAGGRQIDNAVWSYELPFARVGDIRGHLAFYPSLVDAIEQAPKS